MEENRIIKKRYAKDTFVTACSLTVIALQSLIIMFGMYYRWDWIAYECAVMLIIPSVIILYYGVLAIINADKLMSQERRIDEGDENEAN